jgi:chromosome segregation ATPase
LKEVKARLKKEQAAREQAEKKAEQIGLELEQEKNKDPIVEEVVIEKNVIPEGVSRRLSELTEELDQLNRRKELTTEFQQRKRELNKQINELSQGIVDLRQARDELSKSNSQQEQRSQRSARFIAIFRRAAKPLKEAKGELEALAKDGHIHWSAINGINSDLDVLYDVLEVVSNVAKTVDVSNIVD